MYEQIAAAYKVLEEINIRQKDTLLVINKIDALPDRAGWTACWAAIPTPCRSVPASGQGCRNWPPR